MLNKQHWFSPGSHTCRLLFEKKYFLGIVELNCFVPKKIASTTQLNNPWSCFITCFNKDRTKNNTLANHCIHVCHHMAKTPKSKCFATKFYFKSMILKNSNKTNFKAIFKDAFSPSYFCFNIYQLLFSLWGDFIFVCPFYLSFIM